MFNVGMFCGKFLPPHRGHLFQIINAATKCSKLYVIVSDSAEVTKQTCKDACLPVMDLKTRARWLSIELQTFDHVKVIMLDESDIPVYPNGWAEWSKLVHDAIPEKIDVIFSGETEYTDNFGVYFPEAKVDLFDYSRARYPISATEVRKAPIKHWDYILGAARPFFAKKVLITGTESCGKTTIVKYLAKLYHTSWSEESGRYYSERFMGGREDIYTIKDFENIAAQQESIDLDALHHANRIVFHDTDAVVTAYYADLYIHEISSKLLSYINPHRYDMVLMFQPDVTWVDDGQRFNGETEKRWRLHEKLKNMYIEQGFKRIIEIGGNYSERLEKAITHVDTLLYK